MQSNPKEYLRINRDDIRCLLYGYNDDTISEYYGREDLHKLEKQVTKYEDTLIHEGLAEGKTIIIDNTNLSKEYIERFKFWNVPMEVRFFDITLKEALTRNMSRTRKVDEHIIQNQYGKYVSLRKTLTEDCSIEPTSILNDSTLPPVYLLDLDGTICQMNGKRGAFDWKKVGGDDVDKSLLPVIKAINVHGFWTDIYSPDFKIPEIIVVSGRDEVCLPETVEWLKDHNIKYKEIYMRPNGDYRPDWQVKEDIWREICKDYNILAGFDDRMQVVRRGRSLGLKMFQVAYNNF